MIIILFLNMLRFIFLHKYEHDFIFKDKKHEFLFLNMSMISIVKDDEHDLLISNLINMNFNLKHD